MLLRRTAALLAAALVGASLLVGAEPAAAADAGPLPPCGRYASNYLAPNYYPAAGCVTAIDLSPQTIDGRAGGSVTITATATGPAKPCLRAQVPGTGEVRLNPSPTDGRYTGIWTIPAGTAPGSYGVTEIWAIEACEGSSTQWWQNLEKVGSLPGPATTPAVVQVTGDAADAAPEITAVELSGTTFDTTTGGRDVVVRVHALGHRADLTRVYAEVVPIGLTGGLDETTLGYTYQSQANQRVSGTARDGWYESTVRLPGGSNGQYGLLVVVSDGQGRTVLPTRQLRAAGFPSTLTAVTTRAPDPPTALTVRKTVLIPWRLGTLVDWAPPADTSVAVADYLITANSDCGVLPPGQPRPTGGDRSRIYYDWPLIGTCQVTVWAVNGFGRSPGVTKRS
ncbi:hypothetical protein [Cryptosporangium minutisporangium]|uniref:Fibronectin type-III domain-containing protein n=1 Tax=Cryptosporangium minutisporangium TaxID=113569 RepID=A0ABP6TAU5_9ACTN